MKGPTRLPVRVETPRLILRTWRAEDRPAYAEINQDPAVMEHLGGVMSREVSDTQLDRFEAGWAERGYGLYAVELRSTGALAGFIGLNHHRALPDEVEIGWRLARSAWGQGLATEGAAAVRDLAYERLGVTQLVSITIQENVRSIRVMEKLGFAYWRSMTFEQWDLRIYRRPADGAGAAPSASADAAPPPAADTPSPPASPGG